MPMYCSAGGQRCRTKSAGERLNIPTQKVVWIAGRYNLVNSETNVEDLLGNQEEVLKPELVHRKNLEQNLHL